MDELRETKKVTVLSVEPVRQLSRGTVLDFKGRDEGGLVLKYSVFSAPLQAMVKQGEELTLEVITTSRETESGTFVNHKVVAINGQTGGARPGGGGYRQDSPETRASIEAQSALQAIVELRKADKLTDDSPVYKRALKWCEVALTCSPSVLKLEQGGATPLTPAVTKATTLPAEGRIIRPRVASTSRG